MRETEDEIAHIEQRLAALDAMRAAAERQVAASQDLVMGAQHDFYDYVRVHEARDALKAALSDYDHALAALAALAALDKLDSE